MGNLNDFDLDLKKVAEGGNARDIWDSFSSLTSVTSIPCSAAGELSQFSHDHCGDPSMATTPTTGVSAGCCNRNAGGVSPECV